MAAVCPVASVGSPSNCNTVGPLSESENTGVLYSSGVKRRFGSTLLRSANGCVELGKENASYLSALPYTSFPSSPPHSTAAVLPLIYILYFLPSSCSSSTLSSSSSPSSSSSLSSSSLSSSFLNSSYLFPPILSPPAHSSYPCSLLLPFEPWPR